jgi:hypothetical protein
MSTHTVECPSCSSVTTTPPESPEEFRLSHWPIQIKLMGTVIPFLENSDLLVAADCTAFAAPDLFRDTLGDRKLMIGCPKLDNAQSYVEKFTEIFSTIPVKSVGCLRMEVPCCSGMTMVLKEAIKRSGKAISLTETVVGVKGAKLNETKILD